MWLEFVNFNADGSRAAWTGEQHDYAAWVMENVLPR